MTKMILILTTWAGDYSHIKIIEWLHQMNADYLILTGEDVLLGKQKLTITQESIYCNDINLSEEVSSVFYRRWLNVKYLKHINVKEASLIEDITRNNILEAREIRDCIYNYLRKANWIPALHRAKVNKINNLKIAQEIGLKVPDYLVTNSKKELELFFKKHNKQVITKAIGNFRKFIVDESIIIDPIYTKKVLEKDLKNLTNQFTPTFFQKLIVKEFEYRVLFFNDKCYPTLINSQEMTLTELDSRKNDGSSLARLLPAEIPIKLEEKIIKFMNYIDVNIGCLDFIYNKNCGFYFLEVNPVGQFGGYSQRCFLNFEKDIVSYLVKKDEERKISEN